MSTAAATNDKSHRGGPVIAAVDFSTCSEAALLWACRYTEQANLPLVILHIVHEPAEDPGYYTRDPDHPEVPLYDLAERMMSDFLTRVRKEYAGTPGLEDAETRLVEGLPVEQILSESEKAGASLIVMGSHGRTGLTHALIGSKAERVVQLSSTPVTIVKMPTFGEGTRLE